MTGNSVSLPARITLLTGICLFFLASDAVSVQSPDAGPTSGRIILIEPKEPKGFLKIQQAKGVAPVNAAEGMLIRRGFLLTLDPSAKATVICGDGKKRELAPGPQGCPCTTHCTPEVCGISFDGSTIGSTRGPDSENGAFPVVISPRKTLLRNLRPTIRWAPIAGARENTAYDVTLYGDGMELIWTRKNISETRLTYPVDELALTPGRTYKAVVISGGLSSEQDRTPWLGFSTLTSDKERALAAEEIKTKRMQLPETQTRFLLSSLYAARELYSEAIEQLEDLYNTMKEPAVGRMLGDLYATVGLNREAEKEYLKALDLTAKNDLDGLGLIQKNLAQVYENLGALDRAIARLKEARNAYQRLRNRTIVRGLLRDERRLEKLLGRVVSRLRKPA